MTFCRTTMSWGAPLLVNKLMESDGPPHPTASVPEHDLVDELWNNVHARRQLGKWDHPCKDADDDDVLLQFTKYPFTSDINAVLSPHTTTLTNLIFRPPPLEDWKKMQLDVPVLGYLHSCSSSEATRSGIVSFAAGLTMFDQARIANWVSVKVPEAKDRRELWLGRFPLAHAFTLVLAARRRPKIAALPAYPSNKTQQEQERWILAETWQLQSTTFTDLDKSKVDVDKECLWIVEERMFKRSAAAGKAGHFQWGLDKGTHQEKWDRWERLPPHWNHGDRDGSESELEVGRKFIDTEDVKVPQKRPASPPKRSIHPQPVKRRKTRTEC
ncbi:hypothetical protein BKA93DRAFT_932223 [Sparassis latifolia]